LNFTFAGDLGSQDHVVMQTAAAWFANSAAEQPPLNLAVSFSIGWCDAIFQRLMDGASHGPESRKWNRKAGYAALALTGQWSLAQELVYDPGTQSDTYEEAGELKQTRNGQKIPDHYQRGEKRNDFLHLAIRACSRFRVKQFRDALTARREQDSICLGSDAGRSGRVAVVLSHN
jgi:hypothetical protein